MSQSTIFAFSLNKDVTARYWLSIKSEQMKTNVSFLYKSSSLSTELENSYAVGGIQKRGSWR